jgi:hypothetical protein
MPDDKPTQQPDRPTQPPRRVIPNTERPTPFSRPEPNPRPNPIEHPVRITKSYPGGDTPPKEP